MALNRKSGERYNTGYTVFHIPVEIGKRLELVDYGSFKKMGEVVYVKELLGFSAREKKKRELIGACKG